MQMQMQFEVKTACMAAHTLRMKRVTEVKGNKTNTDCLVRLPRHLKP